MNLLDWARQLRDLPGRRRFRLDLAAATLRAPEIERGQPVLGFGGELTPGRLVHGGRVKLTHLARSFATDEERFNLLYLVSSAIPKHAEELVLWAKQRGVKFIWNQNGVGFPAWAGSRCREVNARMHRLFEMADFVVYQSAFCQESADRWLAPASVASEILYNPVDLSHFSPAPEPPPLDCWQLLAAGTHNQPSRVISAIETLKLLCDAGRNAHLTIAGRLHWAGGDAEVAAAVAAAGVGDRVTLRPAFSQADAPTLLRAAHILVHAKYHDPCPTMVVEALACGVPVVGSRSGGMGELLGEDGGALVEVPLSWEVSAYPAPAELAGAIETIMSGWPERSRSARERAELQFDARGWVAAHNRIFSALLAPVCP